MKSSMNLYQLLEEKMASSNKKEKDNGMTLLEVIKGIHQAATNAKDTLYKDPDNKVGLHREEGNPIYDPRIMDGFNVRVLGDTMRLSYHGQIDLKHVANSSRDAIINECESMLSDIIKYMKKEYKKITGGSLTLKDLDKEADVLVESSAFNRSWVTAVKNYKIGNLSFLTKSIKDGDGP